MKKKKNKVKEYLPLYLMMLPGLLYLLINNYLPMTGIILAFKKLNFSKGILASPWAGLDNFKFLFSSKDAWIITRNTLLYNIAFILVNMVVGIAIAILICEVKNTKMKKIYQSAILLPFLMSMVILSYIVYALLSAENGKTDAAQEVLDTIQDKTDRNQNTGRRFLSLQTAGKEWDTDV